MLLCRVNTLPVPGAARARNRYANDTKTDMHISLPNDKFDGSKGKRVEWSYGDGTVPLASLQSCTRWRDVTNHPVKFGGSLSAHTSIVQSDDVITAIIKWITPALGL